MKAKTELKAMAWATLPPIIIGLIMIAAGIVLDLKGREGASQASIFFGMLIAVCGPMIAHGSLVSGNGVLLRYFTEKEQDTLPPASQKPQPGAWREEIKEFRR